MVSQYALRLHLHSQVLYLLLVFSEPQEQSDVTSVSWREKEEEEVERGGIVSREEGLRKTRIPHPVHIAEINIPSALEFGVRNVSG